MTAVQTVSKTMDSPAMELNQTSVLLLAEMAKRPLMNFVMTETSSTTMAVLTVFLKPTIFAICLSILQNVTSVETREETLQRHVMTGID